MEGTVRMGKAEIKTKADYVRGQGQTRNHACHWPGCSRQVPPAMWGCKEHWFMLPRTLRLRIWASYRPGQEKDGKPSTGYVKVTREIQEWIEKGTDRS